MYLIIEMAQLKSGFTPWKLGDFGDTFKPMLSIDTLCHIIVNAKMSVVWCLMSLFSYAVPNYLISQYTYLHPEEEKMLWFTLSVLHFFVI